MGNYAQRLLEEPSTLRILELRPDRGFKPLHVELCHVDLNDHNPIRRRHCEPFQALFYVWGVLIFTETISLPQGSISRIPSLNGALRRVQCKENCSERLGISRSRIGFLVSFCQPLLALLLGVPNGQTLPGLFSKSKTLLRSKS